VTMIPLFLFLSVFLISTTTVTSFSNLNEGGWKSRPIFPELAKPPSSSETKEGENTKNDNEQQDEKQEKWDPIRFVTQSSKFFSLPSISFSDKSSIIISPGDILWSAFSSNDNESNSDQLFTFAPLDDVVMGGVSSSGFDSQTGIWKGTVSEANSGGFVGIRSTPFKFDGFNMEECNGIEVVVGGLKGKGLKIVLRDSKDFNGICWSTFFSDQEKAKGSKFDVSSLLSIFDKSKDDMMKEETVIRIALDELIPTIFARTLPDEILNRQTIQGFQFAYSKFLFDKDLNPYFELGEFEFSLKEIRAY